MFTDTSLYILDLAKNCIMHQSSERPETLWLKEKYERFMKKYNLKNKKNTDQLLFTRMYGYAPTKTTDTLKIRYWRTGQHIPGNREQCVLFGNALELSPSEMKYLIQQYYDRCSNIFHDTDSNTELYLQRQQYFEAIVSRYIQNTTLSNTPKLYLRHTYFTDAYNYIHTSFSLNSTVLCKHISSIHYDSEFTRQLKLIGEIPRKTMIRHLLIFNVPDITLEQLNNQLESLGYLKLTENHTLTTGEPLDNLIINLIRKYEILRPLLSTEMAASWFQEACRTLDYYFIKENYPHLRFMHFKALDL